MKTYEKTYEDGLNEAWKLVRRIACIPEYGGETTTWLKDVFGDVDVCTIIRDYSVSEAIEKIEKYEGIKVGDEVTDNDGWKGVVTWISSDGEYILVMLRDGDALRWKKESFKKTGRHFPQIAEVLKQMQEDEA